MGPVGSDVAVADTLFTFSSDLSFSSPFGTTKGRPLLAGKYDISSDYALPAARPESIAFSRNLRAAGIWRMRSDWHPLVNHMTRVNHVTGTDSSDLWRQNHQVVNIY